jgi:predicted phosphodiesterase
MRKIAILSDTHIGSYFGVSLKEWDVALGSDITERRYANPAQLKLNEYLTDFLENHVSQCDTVILCGDICEGNNRKEFGQNLSDVSLNQQVAHAVELFEPYMMGKTIIGVNGSGYHQGLGQSLDHLVCRELGGRWLGEMGVVEFDDTEVKAHVCHSSGGAAIYRPTVADRESLFMDAAEHKLGYHVDMFIRAHWHWWLYMQEGGRHMVYNPCFKVLFPWSKTSGMWSRFLPSIGGTVITIKGKYIDVRRVKYPHIQLIEKPVLV